MQIPLPWAIALAAAGALLVVALLGVGVALGRLSAPERALAQVGYLLGGGIVGFVALAFPPAWPVLVPVAGLLVLLALREGRVTDVGMLLTGFGLPWVILLGDALLADATDPAINASRETLGWFVFGAAVLVFGLLALVVGAARSRRG